MDLELDIDDQKRSRVLDGAARVFLTYGFQRTKMDDIARAADMSRPALYLLFRNKTDIYRAIADEYLAASARRATAILAGEGSLGERLTRMVDECIIGVAETLAAHPHGEEMLDMKTSLATDILERHLGEMIDALSQSIEADTERRGVHLGKKGISPRGLAEMFWDGVNGMKQRVRGAEDQRIAIRSLVRIVELALED